MARILIIDDQDELRATMRAALEQDGHEILEAHNGAAGLAHFEKSPVDLIITDIMMPDTDGIETIIALRRANAAIRIIAISGGSRVGDTDFLTLARKLGANQILAKPFRRQQLQEAVRASLAVSVGG